VLQLPTLLYHRLSSCTDRTTVYDRSGHFKEPESAVGNQSVSTERQVDERSGQ